MSIAAALSVAKNYRNGTRPETHPPLKIKKHIDFQGLKISIETPKGQIRRGIDHEGKPWANRMAVDYGYIQRTEGKDGDQVDVFVGSNRRSDKVFIIDQLHHHMEKFDEHKCLVGFNDKKQALTAYHRSYGRKYGAHHTVGAVTELSIDAFKEWLKGGGGKEPIAPDVPKFQDGGKVAFDPDYLGKYTPDKTPNVRVREGHQEFEKGYVASGRSPWNTDYPYRPILNMRGQELHALKIQEGGAVPDDPVWDVPGVGPVPTSIPETIKSAARAYSEMPSWLEQAQQQTQKNIEAYQDRGVSGLMADTQPTQELAGGFGGAGIAGTIKKAGPEAVHHWSQAIADALVAKHGADVGTIESSLNSLREATSDRAAVAILAKLPEDVQHELIMRELSRSEGGFGRTGTPPPAAAFREITHPEEARDWLRENASSQRVNWAERDPQYYVELANKMKREEAGLASPPPQTESSVRARNWREEAARLQQEWDESIQPKTSPTLDEFFGLVNPHEVQHMPEDEVLMIHSKLSMAPNANDYQTMNPQLWDALRQRIDEIDKQTERTVETYKDPFTENFEKHIAPLYPENKEQFFHDFFGGMYQPGSIERRYGWDGFYFDGVLQDKDGKTVGMITRSFNPETKTADHSYLRVNPDMRGTGFVPTMLTNQINLYQKLGINKVRLHANIDAGSYAWAKYGWIPDQYSWNTLRRDFKHYVSSPLFQMTDTNAHSALLKILNDQDPRAIWDLADIKAAEVGSTIPIGKALLTNRHWNGTLNLNDARSMYRFFEYVKGKGKKDKTP